MAEARRTPISKGVRNRSLTPPKESVPEGDGVPEPLHGTIPDFVYQTHVIDGRIVKRKVDFATHMASLGYVVSKKNASAASEPPAVATPPSASRRGRAEATGGASARGRSRDVKVEEERRAKPKEPRARAASVGARVNPKGILKPKMDEDPFGWIGTTEYLPLPNSPPTRATSRTQPLRPRAKLAAKSTEFEERPLDEQLEALEGSDYGDHCPEYYEAIPEFGVAESLGFHDDRWTPEQWLAWQKMTWTETQAEYGEDTLYDYAQEDKDHPDDEEPPGDKDGEEYEDEEYYEEDDEPDLPKKEKKKKKKHPGDDDGGDDSPDDDDDGSEPSDDDDDGKSKKVSRKKIPEWGKELLRAQAKLENDKKRSEEKLERAQRVRMTMPDKIDLGKLPTAPHVRQWLTTARHVIEQISFGDDKLVEWWDEIVTVPRRIDVHKPGEYKNVDMLIKTAMLKAQGNGDFASEVFKLSEEYQALTPPQTLAGREIVWMMLKRNRLHSSAQDFVQLEQLGQLKVQGNRVAKFQFSWDYLLAEMRKLPTPDILEYLYLKAIADCEVLKEDIARYKRMVSMFPDRRSYKWLKEIVKNYIARIRRDENNALHTAYVKRLGGGDTPMPHLGLGMAGARRKKGKGKTKAKAKERQKAKVARTLPNSSPHLEDREAERAKVKEKTRASVPQAKDRRQASHALFAIALTTGERIVHRKGTTRAKDHPERGKVKARAKEESRRIPSHAGTS